MRFKSNHDKVCSAKKIVVNMHQVHEFSRKISFSAFPNRRVCIKQNRPRVVPLSTKQTYHIVAQVRVLGIFIW